ncbi:MAG: hypothetical protein U1D30_19435 [Planctomycetota bacterium]
MRKPASTALPSRAGPLRIHGFFASAWLSGRGEPKPAPPTVAEQAELIDRQLRLSIEQYGPERATRQMRKFGIKQAWLHPLREEVHQAFIKLSTPREWEEVRDRYYCRSEMDAAGSLRTTRK